jgi:hypothetical protein
LELGERIWDTGKCPTYPLSNREIPRFAKDTEYLQSAKTSPASVRQGGNTRIHDIGEFRERHGDGTQSRDFPREEVERRTQRTTSKLRIYSGFVKDTETPLKAAAFSGLAKDPEIILKAAIMSGLAKDTETITKTSLRFIRAFLQNGYCLQDVFCMENSDFVDSPSMV